MSLVLSGCGFQPLYEEAGAQSVAPQLATIKVARIADRKGQILKNHLLDRLNPFGEPLSPQYRLIVTLTEAKAEVNLRKDASARRQQATYTADVALEDVATHKIIYTDKVDAVTSFSIGSQAATASLPYVVSEEKARARAMELLADDIQLLLSSYLRQGVQK